MKGNPFLEITEMMKDFLSHQTNYVVHTTCVRGGWCTELRYHITVFEIPKHISRQIQMNSAIFLLTQKVFKNNIIVDRRLFFAGIARVVYFGTKIQK